MNYTLTVGLMTAWMLTTNVYAADKNDCPPISAIQSTPYTDPDLQPPHGEGYKYTATFNGKTWTGQTASTKDDYLEPKYELKAEEIEEVNGALRCSYGGKTLDENGETAVPNLRLTSQ